MFPKTDLAWQKLVDLEVDQIKYRVGLISYNHVFQIIYNSDSEFGPNYFSTDKCFQGKLWVCLKQL